MPWKEKQRKNIPGKVSFAQKCSGAMVDDIDLGESHSWFAEEYLAYEPAQLKTENGKELKQKKWYECTNDSCLFTTPNNSVLRCFR